MSKKSRTRPWSILIALSLAVFIGSILDKETRFLGIHLYATLDLLGKLFINALTLIVVPLVASSIITGVARVASEEQFGRLGTKTFCYFALTNLAAILIGVFIYNLTTPGSGFSLANMQPISTEEVVMAKKGVFSELILDIVPSNILNAFAKGNMLGLIFFSLLFGYAITQIGRKHLSAHLQLWKGVFESMLYIVHGIMRLLPLGVFCLATKIFADTGISTLKPLGNFIWAAIVALAIFAFGFIPLLLKVRGGLSFKKYLRAISPALVTAFSTGSSSATLPISLECMEERAGLSNRICSLIIPLGTSLNLAGTALYNVMAVLFVGEVFAVDFSAANQLFLILVTFLVSFGVASVPGGGLVAILTIVRIMGVPLEALGLLLALDRILDMFRTTTSVFSYTSVALLVGKSEGEKLLLSKNI